MLKIGMLGVAASLLAVVLKKDRGDFAIILAMITGILIFAYGIAQVTAIIDFVKEMIEQLPFETEYLKVLFKMLGITYVAEFSSNICKDAGYQAIAVQIEVFAKISIVAMSLPGIAYLIDVVETFI